MPPSFISPRASGRQSAKLPIPLRVKKTASRLPPSTITKFFGDWHLARIYEHVSARFHLADWHRTIDDKLETLDDLYQLLNHDQVNRWMLMLEVTIVLLFGFAEFSVL